MNSDVLFLLMGPAGSGISTACDIFSDYGFMVTTGIPVHTPEQVAQTVQTLMHSDAPTVFTLRLTPNLSEQMLGSVIQHLKQTFPKLQILLLDAPENHLVARYMHTGKQHYFEHDSGQQSGLKSGLQFAVEAEKKLLQKVLGFKDYAIDTSTTTVLELRLKISKILKLPVEKQPLTVYITTFGFKYGMPQDAELVFDMRFITNPFYDEALRPLNGKDRAIQDFIFSMPPARDFFERWSSLVGDILPLYQEQGKTRLTIAVGCTGGKHRSVCMAEALANTLKEHHPSFQIVVTHREMRRWGNPHDI